MKLQHIWLFMQLVLFMVYSTYCITEKLLFSTPTSLKEIDLKSGVVHVIAIQNDRVFSMAYDYQEEYLYIPRRNEGDIARYAYPNSKNKTFQTVVAAQTPEGIAFDEVNRQLYWTEHEFDGKIMRCDSDGSNVTIIVRETYPYVLTIDIKNGWIFYGESHWNGQVSRLTLDGKDKLVIGTYTTNVYGIKVDVSDKLLYWMNYGPGNLRSAWYNGSYVTTVVTYNSGHNNRNIDIVGDTIFFASENTIVKTNKYLGQLPTVVHRDTEEIWGVLYYRRNGNKV